MAPVLPIVAAVALALLSAPDDAPTYEIDVADVSGAADACPSQDLVAESLAARMPGVVARPGREPGPNVLRLGLTVSDEGVAHVTMTDSTGALRLERDLELPRSSNTPGAAGAHARPAPHDRSGGCAALADTIALIVERYMRHIGYHEPPPPPVVVETRPPPPPPPPPPPAPEHGAGLRLGAGVVARPPVSAPWRLEPELLVGLAAGPVELTASAGLGLPNDQTVAALPGSASATAGTFTWMSVPIRVTAGWAIPVGGRLVLAPSLGSGIDLIFAETKGTNQTRRSSAAEPVVEAGVSAILQLTRRVWIDARAFQGIDLRPEEFVVSTGGNPPERRLFMTPRTYTRLGVDFGISLGKIRGLP
jgi:hypothetical protein